MENNKFLNVLKGIFGMIGRFWHKGFFSKLIVIIIILSILGGISNIKNNISDSIKRKEEHKQTYVWPETELTKLIDKPEWDKGKIEYDNDSNFKILLYDLEEENYHSYVDSCKEKGFTENHDNSSLGSSLSYSAENKNGYIIDISYYTENGYYDEKSLVIEIKKPTENNENVDNNENVENNEDESNNSTESKENDEGMRKEFKEAMDSYEAFFDEYVDFMVKYSETDDVASMLSEYADYMKQYADTMEKMDKINSDELSDEELAYYLEINARIMEKLASIQ